MPAPATLVSLAVAAEAGALAFAFDPDFAPADFALSVRAPFVLAAVVPAASVLSAPPCAGLSACNAAIPRRLRGTAKAKAPAWLSAVAAFPAASFGSAALADTGFLVEDLATAFPETGEAAASFTLGLAWAVLRTSLSPAIGVRFLPSPNR